MTPVWSPRNGLGVSISLFHCSHVLSVPANALCCVLFVATGGLLLTIYGSFLWRLSVIVVLARCSVLKSVSNTAEMSTN